KEVNPGEVESEGKGVVPLDPSQRISKLLYWRVAPRRRGRNCCGRNSTNVCRVKAEIHSALIRKLRRIDFTEEQCDAAHETHTCFVDEVIGQRRAQGRNVGPANRSLRSVVRKIRESRIDVIQKVDNAGKVLVIPDVFDVVFL